MALPRENRLPLRFERDRISREGKTYYSQKLTLVAAPSVTARLVVEPKQSPTSSSYSRFGILLSKKVAKRAVDRNLIRRHIASAITSLLPQFPVADYLVIPKRSVLEIPYTDLLADLSFLLSKLK